jgi:imidazolonepropionase-like amidohydrolase
VKHFTDSRPRRIIAGEYFDGERRHSDGPYAFLLDNEKIVGIEMAMAGEAVGCAFLMPTLVDCHVHFFMDGATIDPALRKTELAGDDRVLQQKACANAALTREAGVGLVRDAAAPRGINHWLRSRQEEFHLRVRSAGPALHRPGRYGSFLGLAIGDDREIVSTVAGLCEHADDIKVMMTGVIDFTSGTVKGKTQFDAEAAGTIVATAHEHGRPAFAHCNGHDGLAIAIRAGFDSVEHGYGMDEESLRAMAAEGVAWTPTLAPVAAQLLLDPAISGFPSHVVEDLVSRHGESILRAIQLGVPLQCGSDAGAQGVPHGSGLIDEMLLMAEAGAPMDVVLRGATSLPRKRWREDSALLETGAEFDVLALPASPFDDPFALRRATRLWPVKE